MSTGIIVGIVVAVVVIGMVAFGVTAVLRRRRLQQRFGPEYDRLVGERDSRRKAEAELIERERRVEDLDIQPLTDPARASFAGQWASIQELFVDTPAEALSAAQLLVVAVMAERGYPAEHPDQVVADLSVRHSRTLDRYRAAEEISHRAAAGPVSTEDLRQAMVHYRALFSDLLGEPAGTGSGSAAVIPAQAGVADDTTVKHVTEAQRATAASDLVATVDTSEQFTESDPKEMAK